MKNTNSLRDEIKISQASLKGQPFSKKWSYFWDYYKWQTILLVFVIVLIADIGYQITHQTKPLLSIALLNQEPTLTSEEWTQYFCNYLEEQGLINAKKETVSFDTAYLITEEPSDSPLAYTSDQKLASNIMAGKIDILIGPKDQMINLADAGCLLDLREVIEESSQSYSLYVKDTDGNSTIPVCIDITSSPILIKNNCYEKETVYLGVVAQGTSYHRSLLNALLKFLKQ